MTRIQNEYKRSLVQQTDAGLKQICRDIGGHDEAAQCMPHLIGLTKLGDGSKSELVSCLAHSSYGVGIQIFGSAVGVCEIFARPPYFTFDVVLAVAQFHPQSLC